MTALPARNVLDGTKVPATTTSEMKTALGSLRDYLNEALGSTGTAPSIPSLNSGPISGLRNRFLNGQMLISQRASVTLVNGSLNRGPDMWQAINSTGTVTAGSFALSTSTTSSSGQSLGILGLSCTSASIRILQRIEANYCTGLNSKQVTVSGIYYQDTGSSITINVQLNAANSKNNFTTATSKGISSAITIPTGVETPFSATFTLGASDANNGLSVEIYTQNLTVTSKNLKLADMQFEIGAVATPIEYRDDLQRCRRFLRVYGGTSTSEIAGTYGIGVSATAADVPLPVVDMISIPTATLSGSWVISDSTTGTTVTSVSTITTQSSLSLVQVRVNVASGLTTFRPYRLETVNTSARLVLSSEL